MRLTARSYPSLVFLPLTEYLPVSDTAAPSTTVSLSAARAAPQAKSRSAAAAGARRGTQARRFLMCALRSVGCCASRSRMGACRERRGKTRVSGGRAHRAEQALEEDAAQVPFSGVGEHHHD